MIRVRSPLLIGSLVAALFAACGDKNAPLFAQPDAGAGGTAFSYATDIVPFLQKACTCHVSPGASIPLYTYANVKLNASACDSAIRAGSMPPSGTLDSADIATFHDWFAAGAPNN